MCIWLHVNCLPPYEVPALGMSEIVRFEVLTAANMKNGVFWDVAPCGSCRN
jgi:hypothetical protein